MIRIDTNAKEIAKQLERISSKQLPFALSLISNRVAKRVQQAEKTVMQTRLDRPTPGTIKSVFQKNGTKLDNSSRVWVNEKTGNGTPANDYLQAQVFGGERDPKPFEKRMITKGLLRSGKYLLPASGVRLNKYGNVSGGQVVQIISAFGAFTGSGAVRNASGSRRSMAARGRSGANNYFWGFVGGVEGIWQRSAGGSKVKPIFVVADRAPKYRKRYPFFQVAENTVKASYEAIAIEAISYAVSTQR